MIIYSAAHDTQVTGQPNRQNLIAGDDDAHLRNHPHCVPILGVAAACIEPPSILQLSRVSGQKPEVLLTTLRPVSKHLTQRLIDVYSVVAVDEPLRSWIFDNEQSGSLRVDWAQCNENVARWCLAAPTCDARQRNWVSHVVRSIPSAELCDAIRASRFVNLPSWSRKLKEIEIWLNKYSSQDLFRAESTLADENSGEMASDQHTSAGDVTGEPTAISVPLDSTVLPSFASHALSTRRATSLVTRLLGREKRGSSGTGAKPAMTVTDSDYEEFRGSSPKTRKAAGKPKLGIGDTLGNFRNRDVRKDVATILHHVEETRRIIAARTEVGDDPDLGKSNRPVISMHWGGTGGNGGNAGSYGTGGAGGVGEGARIQINNSWWNYNDYR
ncbi:hypothetical protein C8R45DRAFT_1132844 [Mycena sanguinolenta]|nr:hypothetical protein C8R45DRAFT_1132844 [Mycena sanguinolenta]